MNVKKLPRSQHTVHWLFCQAEHQHELKMVKSFEELGVIVDKVLKSIDKEHAGKFVVLSGPMTTGGLGDRDANIFVYEKVIELLYNQGHLVFSPICFEDKIRELIGPWRAAHPKQKYCWPLLWEVYYPIFASGLVKRFYTLPGWRSSTGSRWEDRRRREFKIPYTRLSQQYVTDVIASFPDLRKYLASVAQRKR